MNDAASEVSVTRTKADFARYMRILGRDMNLHFYRLIAVAAAGVAVFSADDWASEQAWMRHHVIDGYPAVFSAGVFVTFLIVFNAIYRLLTCNVEYVADNQEFLRPKRVLIDEKGVRETSQLSDRFMAWAGISRIEKTPHYLLFYIDRLTALVIPVRDFASPEAATAFYERAEALRKAAGVTPTVRP